jgi:HEAT repeat protein/PBS lyase HEAT-like repeat-containing protein
MTTPDPLPPPLTPEAAARFAEFARACKSAARAVALYPGSHPAIGSSLGRLAQATSRLNESGPFRLQVRAGALLLDGAASPRPDPALAELAEVLERHLIGALTVNVGADASSWQTLLLLLARPPEEVRADGGIGRLWTTAGGPSLEIIEIDYAEVLREKQGLAATIDQILAAALAGPQMDLDDAAADALLQLIGDPAKLEELMAQLEARTAGQGPDVRTAAFLNLLRGLADHLARSGPEKLDAMFRQMGHAAGRLSADDMVALLARRDQPEAMAGTINVVGATTERMSDASVAHFVAGSVIAEGGATDRLAQAFQSLVPERDRQRQLLALAEAEVSASEVGDDPELWGRVEGMLTSYSDDSFVSSEYGRELATARNRAVTVESTSDDPPERVASWLATVADAALRGLDHQLLGDLLVIETDPLRWRDVAQTVAAHADDLVRVGYFDQAWQLVETVIDQGAATAERQPHARAALERFGRGSMMKHVAAHLRSVPDEGYERFKRICHATGTAAVAPLAEVLSSEQDARARRRLREILLGFGASGREAVQQLMNAPNWEVRRTAAYLLREFGGTEGLKELVPLLTDAEPLVRREAVQGLALNGSDAASALLVTALTTKTGKAQQTLASDLMGIRDRRAVPFFSFVLRHMDPGTLPDVYAAAIEAIAAIGPAAGAEAVAGLQSAFKHGQWWAPVRTRRRRATIAGALRKIGTPEAIEALRAAAASGPRGVRLAARTQLKPGLGD